MLVHNTYTGKEEIQWAIRHFRSRNPRSGLCFCFCPKANLYIKNKLPDFNLFLESDALCCLGTDSLASNHRL